MIKGTLRGLRPKGPLKLKGFKGFKGSRPKGVYGGGNFRYYI